MRQVVVNNFMTLDGVIQGPGGPDEDPSSGFGHGGWAVPYSDEVTDRRMAEFMAKPFALLLGRKTYEIFAGYWPHQPHGPADALNAARKYVASRTLREVEWNNSVLLGNNVPAEVAKLKAEDGPEIQIFGSGDLIQTLISHGLIDVFRIWTVPIVLGTGKRLFGPGVKPSALKLVDSVTSTTGVVIATYVPGGPIEYGSF
jgi:dihydrofolate reductase